LIYLNERIKKDILTIQGKKTLILSDRQYYYVIVFNIETSIDYFETGEFLVILSDREGNLWDVFGFDVSGPRTSEHLKIAPSFTVS